MRLIDIIARDPNPAPWREGDNIPWHEPGFSARMLAEHLTQEHDRASRRAAIINRHVAWIHSTLLKGMPSRVLDLACGPGLYSTRLARLGHRCTGIDYGPASIDFARAAATRDALDCAFHLADIRAADYGAGYDLALLIYGELNVFSLDGAAGILAKCHAALRPGGLLLLEPHTFAAVEQLGNEPASWYSSAGGLFSADPHLVLMEGTWHPELRTATQRYYIVDAQSAEVTRHAQTFQAYTSSDYASLLAGRGFTESSILPGIAPDDVEPHPGLCAIVAARAHRAPHPTGPQTTRKERAHE